MIPRRVKNGLRKHSLPHGKKPPKKKCGLTAYSPILLAGTPSHLVAGGRTSPFISKERSPSEDDSSMRVSYRTREPAPTLQRGSISIVDIFITRSSNR